MATAELPEARVAALEQVLSYLVLERQRLRDEAADAATLEANRRALIAIQARLSHALVDQHAAAHVENRAASLDQEETTGG